MLHALGGKLVHALDRQVHDLRGYLADDLPRGSARREGNSLTPVRHLPGRTMLDPIRTIHILFPSLRGIPRWDCGHLRSCLLSRRDQHEVVAERVVWAI